MCSTNRLEVHPKQTKGLSNLNEIKVINIAVVYQIKVTPEGMVDKRTLCTLSTLINVVLCVICCVRLCTLYTLYIVLMHLRHNLLLL